MAEIILRFVVPFKHKLLEVAKTILDSEISKDLLEKWSVMTAFIQYEDNMLLAINGKHYDSYSSSDSTHVGPNLFFEDPKWDISLNVVCKDATHTFQISEIRNLLANQVYQYSKLYTKIRNPLTLLSDDILDKLKPYHLCIPGVLSYTTYNFFYNATRNNVYADKVDRKSNQLLKCHYIMYSVEDRKHSTVRYVDPLRMSQITREVVRELLQTKIVSFKIPRKNMSVKALKVPHCLTIPNLISPKIVHNRSLSNIASARLACLPHNDINEWTNLIEINQKVFEEVEKQINIVKLLDRNVQKTTNEKSINQDKFVEVTEPNGSPTRDILSTNAICELPQTLIHLVKSTDELVQNSEGRGVLNLYKKPPNLFRKNMPLPILPNRTTFWNTHFTKSSSEIPKVKKPKKYKFQMEEVKSNLGLSRITYLIPVND